MYLIYILIDGTEEDTLTQIIDTMPHGGSRTGSGQKPKYGETVKRVMFKIPVSKVEEITKRIRAILDEYVTRRPKK